MRRTVRAGGPEPAPGTSTRSRRWTREGKRLVSYNVRHAMTAEDMAGLRRKIALYRGMTDARASHEHERHGSGLRVVRQRPQAQGQRRRPGPVPRRRREQRPAAEEGLGARRRRSAHRDRLRHVHDELSAPAVGGRRPGCSRSTENRAVRRGHDHGLQHAHPALEVHLRHVPGGELPQRAEGHFPRREVRLGRAFRRQPADHRHPLRPREGGQQEPGQRGADHCRARPGGRGRTTART